MLIVIFILFEWNCYVSVSQIFMIKQIDYSVFYFIHIFYLFNHSFFPKKNITTIIPMYWNWKLCHMMRQNHIDIKFFYFYFKFLRNKSFRYLRFFICFFSCKCSKSTIFYFVLNKSIKWWILLDSLHYNLSSPTDWFLNQISS